MSCKVSEFDGFYGLRISTQIVYVAPMVEVRIVNFDVKCQLEYHLRYHTRGERGATQGVGEVSPSC